MIHQDHFGDIVGLFLIALGILVFSTIDHGLGYALVSGGMVALKLKNPPKDGP